MADIPEAPTASLAAVRPSVLSLVIKEKAALYSAYMPFLKNGGIFVPTNKTYNLGDEIYLILTLLDDSRPEEAQLARIAVKLAGGTVLPGSWSMCVGPIGEPK